MRPERQIPRRSWQVLALAALLMALAVVPSVSRMSCELSGRTIVVVGGANDCCPEDEHRSEVPSVRSVCCDVFTTEPRRDDYRPQDPKVAAPVTLVPYQAFAAAVEPCFTVPRWTLVTRPPPLPAADLLVQRGAFLL